MHACLSTSELHLCQVNDILSIGGRKLFISRNEPNRNVCHACRCRVSREQIMRLAARLLSRLSAVTIQTAMRGRVARQLAGMLREARDEGRAATRIQAYIRMKLAP